MAIRLDPPTCTPPRAIRLVARCPDGKPIKAATIDGRLTDGIAGETLLLPPPKQSARIELTY